MRPHVVLIFLETVVIIKKTFKKTSNNDCSHNVLKQFFWLVLIPFVLFVQIKYYELINIKITQQLDLYSHYSTSETKENINIESRQTSCPEGLAVIRETTSCKQLRTLREPYNRLYGLLAVGRPYQMITKRFQKDCVDESINLKGSSGT